MKTSDGKPYRLKHPNPIAATQARWDMSDITLYNFDFVADVDVEVEKRQPVGSVPESKSTVIVPKEKRKPLPPIEEVLAKPPVTEPAVQLEPQPVVAPPVITQPVITQPVITQPQPKRAPRDDEVISWCLPARYEDKIDEFYGTTHKSLVYGHQFLFPCIIASLNDLSFQFWTTDPERKITEKSVVYPKEFANGKPLKQYRWWQVVRIKQHENGFLYTASPSTYTPSFDVTKSN